MINRSLELNTILGSALDEIIAVLGMEAGAFRLTPSPDASVSMAIYRGFSKDAVSILEETQRSVSLTQVWDHDRAVIVDDSLEPGDKNPLKRTLKREGLHFFMLQPVRSGNRILGTLGLASVRQKRPTDHQIDFCKLWLRCWASQW